MANVRDPPSMPITYVAPVRNRPSKKYEFGAEAYLDFFLHKHPIRALSKGPSILPNITDSHAIVLHERSQSDLRAFAGGNVSIHLLFLAPKLLKLFLLPLVECTVCPLLHRFGSLSQPFRIVSSRLHIDLVLTDGISPVVGITEEFLGRRRNLSLRVIGIRCRTDMVGKQVNDLLLLFLVEARPCTRMSKEFLSCNNAND
jgi:hypothetical protein